MTYEEFCKHYPDRYTCDIKWGEMDAMQHVNNTLYFRYFESARMVFWHRLEQATQGQVPKTIGPILASTSCKFRRPLYHPDQIVVGARVESIAEDRFVVGHAIWSEREAAIAAEGDAVVVSFDYAAKKKILLPLPWQTILHNSRGLET